MVLKTKVLPTSRAIREELLGSGFDIIQTPKYLNVGDFFNKLCIVDNYESMDEDSRVLLLLEAANFNNFSKLKIERNFFSFTKNSSYIFSLFSELSAELYDIQKLLEFDLYAEYEDHILILLELYKNYEKLCDERRVLDKIFLPKLYRFNTVFAKSLGEVLFVLDGYLTNFEFKLLRQCAKEIPLKLSFSFTKFNKKMAQKFEELGFELEVEHTYELDISNGVILSKKPLPKHKNISSHKLSTPLLQVAFIEQKIYEYINKGYDKNKIVVILPDEEFAQKLRAFSKNFNFAMGRSFSSSKVFATLRAAKAYLEEQNPQNRYRAIRTKIEFVDALLPIYNLQVSQCELVTLLGSIIEDESVEVSRLYKKALYDFELLLKKLPSLSVKSAFLLFLQRLSKLSIDEVGGGSITVMGVLESRYAPFDAVVVVDFDEANVPKKSNKDMFINSDIKELASLPTHKDRQNLQKYYYDMLFRRSKEVAICYAASEQNGGSMFLDELGVKEGKTYDESSYLKIIAKDSAQRELSDKKIVLEYDFSKVKLSSSALKTFLECKRKYYYRYIKKLSEHKMLSEDVSPSDVGNLLHSALKELYANKTHYESLEELRTSTYKHIEALGFKNELERYHMEYYKKALEPFFELEMQRFANGYRVFSVERYVERSFCGMSIGGYIDRIDELNSKLCVIDYKSGNINTYNEKNYANATDFQLEFYYLLASDIKEVSECAFYDLKSMKLVPEPFFEEKLLLLENTIKELLATKEFDFSMCEDEKNCKFCSYKMLCGRE